MMNEVINQCISICKEQIETDEFKQQVLDPIVNYIGRQLWPYIAFAIGMWVLLMIVLIVTMCRLKYHIQ